MAPVDLHLLTRVRLEADKRLSLFYRTAQFTQQVPYNGNPASKAIFMQPLQDHGGFYFWVLIQPLVNQVKIWGKF